jgi:hypothetical protein
VIGLLIAVYPAYWRLRYGEEFRAVLESRPLGPFDVADVLLGAIDARFALRFAGAAAHGGHVVMLRLGGSGAVFGGVLWFLGMAVASASGGSDGTGLLLVTAGTFGLLFALVGLSAFQAYRAPRLAWAAFGIPAIGAVVSLVGLVGMTLQGDDPWVGSWSGWSVWMIGLLTTLIGSVLFAVATIRAAVLSRRAAMALAASSVVVVVVAAGLVGTEEATDASRLLIALSLLAFSGSWVALGVAALRRGPIRAIAPA